MNKIKLCLIALAFLISFNATSQSEREKDPSEWTPEDILSNESLRSVSFSPDKKKVVYIKNKQDKKKDKYIYDIYVTYLDKVKDYKFRTIQLTSGNENDYNPIFSKDSESVYFLSSREKANKLWKISLLGGEPEKVHEFKNGISNLQWKDANTLLFVSGNGKTLYQQEQEEIKDNVMVIEDTAHWVPDYVFSFDIKSKSVSRLTANEKPMTGYIISPDGKWLYYGMQRSRSYGSDGQRDPFSYLMNLEDNSVKQVINDLSYPVGNIQFSKDCKGFYFMSEKGSDPKWNGAGISELYYYTIASDSYQKINLRWEMGADGGYTVAGNDVIVALSNKTTMKLAYFRKKENNWSKLLMDLGDKNDHVSVYSVSEDASKIIYMYSTASKLPSYLVADLKENKLSSEKELVSLNKQFKKKLIAKSEVITWEGYNGEEVTGLLYYPKDYKEGTKYPLMLSIHGGPSAATLDRWSEGWSSYPNLLSQKGMFVLKPNYHGSSNHGLGFVESIKGNYYDPEMEDITKGIDYLVKKGLVNKNELGTMGWSNGAILTTMLTVRFPNMFKVAAAGAGDVNWTSDYGTCGFGVKFDQSYFGGAPWDNLNGKIYNENYILKSPLFEMEKVITPTIIFHGSEDRAVPRDQGWEYYRALQQIGKAPVKFLWFPGQPHGLGKITHQLRKLKEEISWIDLYMLNKESEKNESFKQKSPLANRLILQKYQQVNGFYGVEKSGLLIPETVALKKDSIELGIFEITNAQFKSFDSKHTYEDDKANYPVVTSRQKADSYVKWLSEKTGDKYRLPNKDEAEELHKKAISVVINENSLNYWAGYKISRLDVAGINEKIKQLNSSLLQPVGMSVPIKIGEAYLYDLGGNVSEFYEKGNYGFSAYDFFDENVKDMIKSSYVGIRVIKE